MFIEVDSVDHPHAYRSITNTEVLTKVEQARNVCLYNIAHSCGDREGKSKTGSSLPRNGEPDVSVEAKHGKVKPSGELRALAVRHYGFRLFGNGPSHHHHWEF